MAYFAKLDINNNVIEVNIIDNSITLIDGVESEQAGIDFLTQLWNHPFWKQTSYNTRNGKHILGGTPFRKNYAGEGFVFREDLNAPDGAFVPPQPFASWILNQETCNWEAPTAMPTDGKFYVWDEVTLSYISVADSQAEQER